MATERITEAELLETLAQHLRGTTPDEARTVNEIMGDTGWGKVKVTRVLQKLQAQNRLVPHRVYRTAIDGTMRPSTAYTMLAPA